MKGKTGICPDTEFGLSGLGDGFSGLGMDCWVEGLTLVSLLLGPAEAAATAAAAAVGLGEGFDLGAAYDLRSADATAAVDEEDSQRDFRWWDWAEKEE